VKPYHTKIEIQTLKEIALVMHQGINTVTEKIHYQETGFPIIQSKHITQRKLDLSDTRFVGDSDFQKYKNKYKPQKYDILICNIGTIGKSILITEEVDFLIAWNIFLLRLDNSRILSSYCKHYLDYLCTRNYFAQFLTGGTVKFVNKSNLGAIKIPLPSLEEQRRIAEILDRAEELRSKRREAIAQLDTLTQAIFLEMFGDPLSNPNNFPIQKLGELCSRVIDCPHSTPTYATKITPYACVRSSDIQNSELIFSDVKYLELEEYKKRIERGAPQQGDVIYCREGARFGNAALVTDNTPLICLGQRMMLFRPENSKANGEFIWGYLSNPIAYHQAVREVGGSASPHINIRDIIAFQIPVPSLNRQCEFAQRIYAVNKLKASHRASLSELDALFASLQHRAFRGEL
jgi:type I restriction enzyme S subunit